MNQTPLEVRQMNKVVHLYNLHVRLIRAMTEELNSDLGFATGQWRQNPTSKFWRRTVVRCICAFVEGIVGLLKHFPQPTADCLGVELSEDDIGVITESRQIVENGISKRRRSYLRFRDNVEKTFAVYTKAHRTTVPIKYDDPQFECLCATFRLRNRLMHPKVPSDLEVSDEAMDKADQGAKWFHGILHVVLEECERKLPWLSSQQPDVSTSSDDKSQREVPEGRTRIARRFSAGNAARDGRVP